jgi:hypothetical protein
MSSATACDGIVRSAGFHEIILNSKYNTPRSDTPHETRQSSLSVARNDREHAGTLPQQPILRTDTADGPEPGSLCDCQWHYMRCHADSNDTYQDGPAEADLANEIDHSL